MEKECVRRLFKVQVIQIALFNRLNDKRIFDESYLCNIMGAFEIDEIVLDYIPIPKHNCEGQEDYDAKKPLCNREWYFEQLSCIADEVLFEDNHRGLSNIIINNKEIDSYLDDFLEKIYENQIQ